MLLYELIMKTILVLFIFLHINYSYANNLGSETKLDLPRYVSLKSSESNLRVGPSKNYPILIKFIVSDYPLKIVDEHKEWRNIVDFQNNKGWVHKSLLKGERNGIIISTDKKLIEILNTVNGKNIGQIDIGLIVKLLKCKKDWCLIAKNNKKGWINKKNIWGVNKEEEFNIGFLQIFIDNYFRSVNFLEGSKFLPI